MNNKKDDQSSLIDPDAFDFDSWVELYETDPERAETLRAKLINNFIDTAPADKKEQLQTLQLEIDRVRSLSSDPLKNAMRLSTMMLAKYGELEEQTRLYFEKRDKSLH